MAKKDIDITKSAEQCESDLNSNFDELYDAVGPAIIPSGSSYGTSTIGGEPINGLNTPASLITTVNTVRMIKELSDSRINVSEHYGHEPQMVIHDGKAYIVYRYHKVGGGEDNSSMGDDGVPSVRMTIVTLADNSIDYASVAKKGDTYTLDGNTVTIADATAPNLVLLDTNNDNTIDTLRIVFSSAPNKMFLYRDYNISSGQFGDIGVVQIRKTESDEYVSASYQNFSDNIEQVDSKYSWQLHSQYAFVKDKYYVTFGNTENGSNHVNIFTTQDFIHFTWFVKPVISGVALNFRFEMALYPWINSATSECCLYLAIRRDDNATNLIVARMHLGIGYWNGSWFTSHTDPNESNYNESHHEAGKIDIYKLIPCKSSRPCFFAPVTKNDFLQTRSQQYIFLAYANVTDDYPLRTNTDFCYFKQNTMTDSNVRRIAQCLKLIYPSIAYYGGEYYVAYQGSGVDLQNNSQPHIYLSKFRPFSATFDKVVSALNKMFDTFAPE